MQAKKFLAYLLVLAVAAPVYIGTGLYLREQRKPETAAGKLRDFPFPVEFYKVAAGEFSGLSADFLYLDIASALGGRNAKSLNSGEWDKIQKAFAVANGLDPYFEPVFRTVQAYMTWSAERYEEAIELLEPANEKRTWDWQPAFYIGFDHYFFLKDNAEGSRYFLEAAQRENAPTMLATLGSRLAAESGNAALGIDFLQRMMATAQNDDERKTYQERIEALQGVVALEAAVARYRAELGRNPPDLWALMLHGYIQKMPYNPYYPQYFYRDGVVRFDPFPTRSAAAKYPGKARKKRPEPPPLLKKNVPQA